MLPGLFRTLVGLVVAWCVFRFLDRMLGGRRSSASWGSGGGASRERGASAGRSGAGAPKQAAKDDHLGEYVDYEEVDGED